MENLQYLALLNEVTKSEPEPYIYESLLRERWTPGECASWRMCCWQFDQGRIVTAGATFQLSNRDYHPQKRTPWYKPVRLLGYVLEFLSRQGWLPSFVFYQGGHMTYWVEFWAD